MLNEWSCPFALWLNSPHIQGASSAMLKTCGLFKHRLESPLQMHIYFDIRFFSAIKIRLARTHCVLTENTRSHRFSPMRFNLILHISFVLICVKWKQTSQTHHRWTRTYCVPTKTLCCETRKVGCTSTALSFFIPSLALSVGIAVTHLLKKHTHSADVFSARRKNVFCLQGIFSPFFQRAVWAAVCLTC